MNHPTMLGNYCNIAQHCVSKTCLNMYSSKPHKSDTQGTSSHVYVRIYDEEEKEVPVTNKQNVGIQVEKTPIPKTKVVRDEKRARDKAHSRKPKVNGLLGEAVKVAKQQAAGVADAVAEQAEDERKENEVVHPWHLSFYKHVRLDSNMVSVDDPKRGHGVYRIAQFSDNLSGKGLYRLETGTGTVRLSSTWRNLNYIRQACLPLASEALGKNDLDLRVLTPRGLQLLKAYVEPWQGAMQEVQEFLMSNEFLEAVIRAQLDRVDQSKKVLTAKTYRLAANIGAAQWEADLALKMFHKSYKFQYLLCSLWFISSMSFSIFFRSWIMGLVSMIILVGLLIWLLGLFRCTKNVMSLYGALIKAEVVVHYGSLINVFSTCSKGISIPKLLTQWKFKLSGGDQCAACGEKAPYDSYGTFIQGATMVVPKGCHHDQYNGLAIRFFFERLFDKSSVYLLVDSAKQYCQNLNGRWISYSYEDWVTHLGGKRMRMLLEEPEAVFLKNYIPVDIFVKMETYLGKVPSCFKPRIIQGRRLGYQNVVGPFFYSVSKWLATVFNHETSNLIYDNGLDALELGRIAQNMFTNYRYVYEIDVSNWDGSLCPELIRFEVWFIENVLPFRPERWEELKKDWCRMSGVGKKGVRFETVHSRRSGDMWTSSFNSLINLMILNWLYKGDIQAVAKGDDNFYGTNTQIDMDALVAAYASIGMKAKIKLVDRLSELGYCSGGFWPVEGGYKWGLKPFRIISKLGLNLNRNSSKIHSRLLLGTAISMLPIGGHVPFLGTLLRAIVEAGNEVGAIPIIVDEPWKTSSVQVDPIHPTSYGLVEERYQIDVDDIDDMELALCFNIRLRRKLQLSDFPMVIDDDRFLRGFSIDTDADLSDSSNIVIKHQKSKKNPDPVDPNYFLLFVVCVISPLFEELMRSFLGPLLGSVLIGSVEYILSGNVYNLVLHSFFGWCMLLFGVKTTMLVHSLHNFLVWLTRTGHDSGYGSLWCELQNTSLRTRSWRRAVLFKTMVNCVALSKYRLISTGAPWLNRFYTIMGKFRIKKNSNNRKGARPSQKRAPKRQTPASASLGRQLLRSGLGGLGGLLGPAGSMVGASLGDWGANVLGMGDYEVKSNTLLEGNGVPKMHATKRGVTISHREFLGDITGSTGFVSRNYSINPGSSNTFPWLSNIAAMFQSYRIKGMIFEFNSTSADALNSVNTALGTVIMSTQYNVALPPFINKAEMEQYDYTVSGRPSRNLTHCVECDPQLQVMPHLFTRTGVLPVGADYQFYDWGNFQFATVGMQAAATIGELWVSYEVEFLKPRIASGGAWPGDFTRINNGPYVTANDILGSIQTAPKGNLGVTIQAGPSGWQRIYFPNTISAGRFFIHVYWKGAVGAVITGPGRTYSNMTVQNTAFRLGTVGDDTAPNDGATATKFSLFVVATINGYSDAGSYLQITAPGGTLPATPETVDIFVVAMPLSDTGF